MTARITQQQLESYLWGAAVLLRGTIDAGDYFVIRHPTHPGTSLMFLATPLALGPFWALFVFLPVPHHSPDLERRGGFSERTPGYSEYR